jgi:cytochrome c5
VSKQDTHFFNVFSMVIGLLVAVAIALFALARVVAGETQEKDVLEDASYVRNVEERVAPFAKEAIAGQDNATLAIKSEAGSAAGAGAGAAGAGAAGEGTAGLPKNGEALFQQTCSACHGAGLAGAPKAGDKAAWGPRIAKGMPTLYEHALKGFQGGSGVMPPKGGRTELPDDLVKQAVDYMANMAK